MAGVTLDSRYGQNSNHYRLLDVHCGGSENNLGACRTEISADPLSTCLFGTDAAGVECGGREYSPLKCPMGGGGGGGGRGQGRGIAGTSSSFG